MHCQLLFTQLLNVMNWSPVAMVLPIMRIGPAKGRLWLIPVSCWVRSARADGVSLSRGAVPVSQELFHQFVIPIA